MAVEIEHEIQRQMLERLGIEWTPGEPFYALVEDEILRLRAALEKIADSGNIHPSFLIEDARAALGRPKAG